MGASAPIITIINSYRAEKRVIRKFPAEKSVCFFYPARRNAAVTRALPVFISFFVPERDLNCNLEILILKWFGDEARRVRCGCTFNGLIIGL